MYHGEHSHARGRVPECMQQRGEPQGLMLSEETGHHNDCILYDFFP